MTFDPKTIQNGIVNRPRKVLIYGPPKIGKSTLAGSTKDALLVPTEDRVDHIECSKTPLLTKMEDLFDIVQYYATEGKGTIKRLTIDTIDWLEPLIWDWICRNNKWKSITDDYNKETAFQKGLKYHAVEGWKEVLKALDFLRDNGVAVILIAHSTVVKVDPPEGDSYDKNVMKIDKNALSVVEEWADVIGYYNRKVFVKSDEGKSGKAVEGDIRMLNVSGRSPAFISGNSFGIEDMEVDLSHASEIMEYLITHNSKNEPTKKGKGKLNGAN